MAISPKSFLVIETSLQKRLQKNWNKIKKRIVTSMLLRLDEEDHVALAKLVNQIKLERALEKDTKYANLMGVQAMYFGISRITPIKHSKSFNKPKIRGISAKSTKQLSMILRDSSKLVRKRVRQALADEYHKRTVVTKAEIIRRFVSSLNHDVGADSSLQLVASLHTSRLATMGHLVESVAQGRKTTIWNAVLDSRTCPICSYLDQRVFSVEIIWRRMEKAIEADTVEDLKRLSPWPSQTKAGLTSFRSMTTSELHMNGYDSPPLHPLDRCYLDVTEQPMEEISTTIIPTGSGLNDLIKPKITEVAEYTAKESIADAEVWAKANVADSVDFTGLDLDVANEVNKTLHEMVNINKYPRLDALKTLDSGGLAYASSPGNEIILRTRMFNMSNLEGTDTWTSRHEVLSRDIKKFKARMVKIKKDVPEEEWGDIPSLKRYAKHIKENEIALKTEPDVPWGVDSGRGPVGNIIIHEYGHTSDNRAMYRLIDEILNSTDEQRTKVVKDYAKLKYFKLSSGKKNEVFMKTISEYGGVNSDETVAESWAAYHSPLKDTLPEEDRKYIEALIKGDTL